VQDLLGHAEPGITKQVYAQYTPAVLGAAFGRASRTPDELAAELEVEASPMA
jgi:hypothetical protein